MRLIIVILSLSCIACGHKHRFLIEPQYQPYVSQFIQEGNLQVDDLIIRSTSDALIDGKYSAKCTIHDNKTPEITVSTPAWSNLHDLAKEALIYHEMGHCILNRGHRDDVHTVYAGVSPHDQPYSLMFPASEQVVYYHDYYLEHRQEFINELFQNAPKIAPYPMH